MHERPVVSFRAADHVDFKFLFVPESGFTPVLVVTGILMVGAVLFLRSRRRRQQQR